MTLLRDLGHFDHAPPMHDGRVNRGIYSRVLLFPLIAFPRQDYPRSLGYGNGEVWVRAEMPDIRAISVNTTEIYEEGATNLRVTAKWKLTRAQGLLLESALAEKHFVKDNGSYVEGPKMLIAGGEGLVDPEADYSLEPREVLKGLSEAFDRLPRKNMGR